MRLTNEQIRAACEAILFASGEPVEAARIAEALELDIDTVNGAMWELGRALDERGSGICLLRLGSKYQLCSRSDYAQQVRSVLDIKKNAPLSPAAFEVLAVVAYNQPVTKAYVEQIRGVDCSGVIATLCQKKLIEEKGRLELPGRPLVYGTTTDFLRCFSFSSLGDLPELPNDQNTDRQLMLDEAVAESEKGESSSENE